MTTPSQISKEGREEFIEKFSEFIIKFIKKWSIEKYGKLYMRDMRYEGVALHLSQAGSKELKNFILSREIAILEGVREWAECAKRKKGTDDYVLSDQNAWYNQALQDLLAFIEKEIELLSKNI